MDFTWSSEQLAFKEAVIKFARNELNNDNLISRDRSSVFSWSGWKKCADFGIHGLPIPKEFGGHGSDLLTTTLVMEALGYACRDKGLIFSINAHMWSAEIPILYFGTEEQKNRFLPKLCSGEYVEKGVYKFCGLCIFDLASGIADAASFPLRVDYTIELSLLSLLGAE